MAKSKVMFGKFCFTEEVYIYSRGQCLNPVYPFKYSHCIESTFIEGEEDERWKRILSNMRQGSKTEKIKYTNKEIKDIKFLSRKIG